jgi:endonuclease YncB( thermonuclease family)
MFLRARLFSGSPTAPALPVAGAIFILGIITGGMLGSFAAPVAPATRPAERIADRHEPRVSSESRLSAEVVRVIDGDTFEARVHAWPGIEITTRVRLRGIDAPEMSANCRDEAIKAEAARAALQAILAQGAVSIGRVAPDKYGGRVVADAATRGTTDVSAAMLDGGHARRYSGGRREGWCG